MSNREIIITNNGDNTITIKSADNGIPTAREIGQCLKSFYPSFKIKISQMETYEI